MDRQDRNDQRGDREEDRGGRRPIRDVDAGPGLDEAGGIDRQELNPRRSGARPVEQNDRTRDRELSEPTP